MDNILTKIKHINNQAIRDLTKIMVFHPMIDLLLYLKVDVAVLSCDKNLHYFSNYNIIRKYIKFYTLNFYINKN